MHKTIALLLGTAALGLAALVPSGDAQTTFTTTRIISGAARPVWVGAPPGDKERLFVVEQNTRLIRIFKNGAFNVAPFLNVSTLASFNNERGLLSMAFHPNYAENGYFFINYTALNGATNVARLKVSSDPDVGDFASGIVILNIPQPFANHNGGNLVFGPDGYLYIGTGDGGSGGDPGCRAQNPNELLGKMLRIDVDTIDTTGIYGIPSTNPFVGNPAYKPEIWQVGLRNPWRYSFDRVTGDMYIGDVGQDQREEISFQPAGVGGINYGWKVLEGNVCFSTAACAPGTPSCGSSVYTAPIHTYNHGVGGICSVTGGVVYRGCAIPDLQGTYFFADFCSSAIWSFRYDGATVTEFRNQTAALAPGGGLSITGITHFGEDADGELLIVDSNGGEVFKVIPVSAPAQPCPTLEANWGVVSASSGGTQTLDLNMGAASAGSFYLLAGSVSGTSPGFPLDGQVLPLNPDFYTLITVGSPNQPPLANSLGVLNGAGQATMSFGLPAGVASPSDVGLVLHHAAAVISPLGVVTSTSNAVAVKLVP